MPPLTWLACKYAFQNSTTPYLVFIDDELCPNALEVFLNNINKIEMTDLRDGGEILEIRALSVDDNGVPVIGDRKLRENLFKPYDMSYIESNFKLTSMENLSCFDVEKVRRADVFHLGEYWLKGKALSSAKEYSGEGCPANTCAVTSPMCYDCIIQERIPRAISLRATSIRNWRAERFIWKNGMTIIADTLYVM